jgi:EmrB/QacA subfamily drug resistance transporter
MVTATTDLRMGSNAGRWVIATSVLGSGVAFIDGTVVNAALPAIADDLDADLAGLQWVITGYLLSLTALLVIGGSLGDLWGRRTAFVWGIVGFAITSMACGAAPTVEVLVAARIAQGASAALLIPASLAMISSTFAPDDRGAAIGAWSGLAGVAGAIGPFVGGWLIDAITWRAVFYLNVPLCVIVVVMAVRHVPDTRDEDADGRIDVAGGGLLAVALAGIVYALIEGPAAGWTAVPITAGVVGAASVVAFLLVEARSAHPMVPLDLFSSRQFSGANATTLFVYAALGATTFFVVLHLQTAMGYSALEAGASFLPLTVLMMLFSARSGALAQRIGPRAQMSVGPAVLAAGIALFVLAQPGRSFWVGVLPATVVMGVGLTILVAPLTAAVLAAVDDPHAGVGSAINNAVARLGGVLAVAVLPAAVGLTAGDGAVVVGDGYERAMIVSAGLAGVGGVVAWLTIRTAVPVTAVNRGAIAEPCLPPCVEDQTDVAAA